MVSRSLQIFSVLKRREQHFECVHEQHAPPDLIEEPCSNPVIWTRTLRRSRTTSVRSFGFPASNLQKSC